MPETKFYNITTAGRTATVNIFGSITSYKWRDKDVDAYSIKSELDALDVDEIDVYINSYGGEVAEAVAICSTLKNHKAKIITHCSGFACSAASLIFCAGDERIMSEIGFLMIHNVLSSVRGNAKDMREQADNLDKINTAAIKTYMAVTGMSEEDIKSMMDKESWITADEALKMGFCTAVDRIVRSEAPEQSGLESLHKIVQMYRNGEPVPKPQEPKKPELSGFDKLFNNFKK